MNRVDFGAWPCSNRWTPCPLCVRTGSTGKVLRNTPIDVISYDYLMNITHVLPVHEDRITSAFRDRFGSIKPKFNLHLF